MAKIPCGIAPGKPGAIRTESTPPRLATAADGLGDALELGVGVSPDRADRCQADDHDQGQHDGVFNSGWAIFRLQKLLDVQKQILHGVLQFGRKPRGTPALALGQKQRDLVDCPRLEVIASRPAVMSQTIQLGRGTSAHRS